MSSHIGKTYLDSCVKVPIDPCNNCPAPFFNRPKIYLGRFSVTPNSCNIFIKKHCDPANPDTRWSCSGVRSLAKLYDSIPDYRDLNHLSGEDFYTTLNSLRSTCRELEIKTICHKLEDQSSTTTTSSFLAPVIGLAEKGRSKKCKKSKKKKNKSSTRCHKSEHADFANSTKTKIVEDMRELNACLNSCCTLSKSSRKDSDKEVEKLKRSLDEFEAEFKRRFSSSNRDESHPIKTCSSKENLNKTTKQNKQSREKVPARNTFTPTLRERLRKSLSFNDLHSSAEPPELEEFREQNKTLPSLSFKGESNLSQDTKKLSNYFKDNSKQESIEIPKIIVDSAETDNSSIKQKSKQKSFKNEEYKVPFKLFHLDSSINGKNVKHSTPSPIHPVARPNLAATLRAESSKKKVQDLKTNCTFHDTNAQFDWEVRKTPAWKTLSLNETHKQILQLRLATRKAEQALQKREYELNMELMRQRVKSAPLLLEGPTHWGPQVGKLTHSCRKDERHHLCQRTKRRNNSSHDQNCSRRLFSITSTLEEENSGNPANTFRIQTNSGSEVKQKMNELRKIYGGSTNITKSQSRCSNRSTTTQTSLKSQKRIKSKNVQKKENKLLKAEANFEAVEIDSGDELSSLDRAFL